MKDIKRVFKTLLVVTALVVLLDSVVGITFDRLISSLPEDGEKVAKANFVINKMNSECVIIGSSRALAHYDTKVLEDSLPDYSIYNAGVDGQGTYYIDILVNLILNRYTPKIILWDFKYLEFTKPGIDNLSMLYPYYYSNKEVMSRLNDLDPYLKYKIWLNSYRYNGTASRILKSHFSQTSNSYLGFEAHSSAISSKVITCDTIDIENDIIDQQKVDMFVNTLKRIKELGIELFVVLSPTYDKLKGTNKTLEVLKELANEYNISIIDYSQDSEFVGANSLIYDKDHLNAFGAELFTKKMINKIKMLHVDTINEEDIPVAGYK